MPPSSEDPTSAAAESAPLAPAAADSEAPPAETPAEIPAGSAGEAAPGERPERPPRRRRRRRRKPAPAGTLPAAEPAGADETAAIAATAPPAADDTAPPAARPRRRRRRHRPRPNPNPPTRLLGIAEAGLTEDAAADATASEGDAGPAAAEGAAGRLRLRLRRPRAPRPLGSAVRPPAAEAATSPVASEDAPADPARRPRRRRRKPAASLTAPSAETLQNGREDRPQAEGDERETGRRPHRGDPARRRGESERGLRGNGRAGPRGDRRRGPQDRSRGEGRGRARPEPERKLYALEAVVDRGFEDVEEEGEIRRIPWTILKRTVADQKSGRQMSAVYVLQRDGADQEFPNLGAARGAAHKTIVHPEKLTLSKAEHAAARGGGDGKKGR